jgi:hypothetical protein
LASEEQEGVAEGWSASGKAVSQCRRRSVLKRAGSWRMWMRRPAHASGSGVAAVAEAMMIRRKRRRRDIVGSIPFFSISSL